MSTRSVKLLYTSSMDVVRFGRALGFGARQAVKTVTAAVDAATAENPSRKSAGTSASAGANAGSASPRPQASGAADPPHTTAPAAMSKAASIAAHGAARTVVQARTAKRGLRHGSQRFGPHGGRLCASGGCCGWRLRASSSGFSCSSPQLGCGVCAASGTPTRRDTGNCWARWRCWLSSATFREQLCSGAEAGTSALGISPFSLKNS